MFSYFLAERVAAADALPGSIYSSHCVAEDVSDQRVTAEKPFSDVLGNTLLFQRSIVGTTVGNRTTKRISAASLPRLYKTPGYHCDGGGLYLQVTAAGTRSWIFRFMLNKRAREMGLGAVESCDLASARAKVGELRTMLANGIDPIEQRAQARRQQVADRSARKTFDECVEDYLERQDGAWTNAKHAAQWKNTLATYASPFFGKWPVADITAKQVIAVIEPIWLTKHETATRVLQRIRLVLIWSATQSRRPPLPDGIWDSVASSLKVWTGKTEHHAACPYPKAGSLIVAVRDSTASDIVKLGFVFTVLTAARSGETRGAVWAEIDFERAVWTIPADRMKAGVEHRVPLCDAAVQVLREAEKHKRSTDLVFSTPKDKPFSDMVFTQLLRRLKFPYTMHGFRSTFRVWAAEQTHYPRDICEAALAHKVESKVEAAYRRSDLVEKRRPLMADWAAYLEQTANV